MLWRACGNRSVPVALDEDRYGHVHDLETEVCLENTECGDVVDPDEKVFVFLALHVDGLRRNLVSADEDSWKSSSDWRDLHRLWTAVTMAAGSYGQVTMNFDSNEREVSLKEIGKQALSFHSSNAIT